jgi:uncharacterized protein (TIGR00730 family)
MMRRVCVFCGSSFGNDPVYRRTARSVGALLAERHIELVYGGGNVGLMGEIANAALEHGGHVIGVIPRALAERELAHMGLPDLRIVESMHERKALMADLADGFIALPGGLGTLEEFCEILTWAQLGFHAKPCGLLSVNYYFKPLMTFLSQTVTSGFLRPEHLDMVFVEATVEALLARFDAYRAPDCDKWISRDQT